MKRKESGLIEIILILFFACFLLILSILGIYFLAAKITIYCERSNLEGGQCVFAKESILNFEKYSYNIANISYLETIRAGKSLKLNIINKSGNSINFPLTQLDRKQKYEIEEKLNQFLKNKNSIRFVYEEDLLMTRMTVYCIALIGFIAFYLISSTMISRFFIFLFNKL